MTPPTIARHSVGRIILTFPESSQPFLASHEAEAYLEQRGFSVGRRQGPEARGILFGDFDIQKWRNLNSLERKALHGVMTGNGRQGPIKIEIYADAPVEVRRAIEAVPAKADPLRPDPVGQALARAADVAAFVTLLFCLGSVAWVGSHPIWARPSGKIVLRAGPLVTIEARR